MTLTEAIVTIQNGGKITVGNQTFVKIRGGHVETSTGELVSIYRVNWNSVLNAGIVRAEKPTKKKWLKTKEDDTETEPETPGETDD